MPHKLPLVTILAVGVWAFRSGAKVSSLSGEVRSEMRGGVSQVEFDQRFLLNSGRTLSRWPARICDEVRSDATTLMADARVDASATANWLRAKFQSSQGRR